MVDGRGFIIARVPALPTVRPSAPAQQAGRIRRLGLLTPDVILAIGSAAIRAAKEATTTIPIVVLNDVDPVAAGRRCCAPTK